MTRREKRQFCRREQHLRRWLSHYAGCHMCQFDLEGEFSRVGLAAALVDDYRGKTRRPVRVPRRFWSSLGRTVAPQRVPI